MDNSSWSFISSDRAMGTCISSFLYHGQLFDHIYFVNSRNSKSSLNLNSPFNGHGVMLRIIPLFPVIFKLIRLAKLMAGLKKEAVDSFLSKWLPVSSCSLLGHMTTLSSQMETDLCSCLTPTLRLSLLLAILGSDNLK